MVGGDGDGHARAGRGSARDRARGLEALTIAEVEHETDVRATIQRFGDRGAHVFGAADAHVLGADRDGRGAVGAMHRNRPAAQRHPSVVDAPLHDVRRAEEARHDRRRRPLEQAARVTLLDDAPLDHERQVLGELGGLRAVVADHERRDLVLGLHARDQAAQLGAAAGIQRRERLVEQQQPRAGAEGPRERDALLLAARQALHAPAGETGEADLVQAHTRGHAALDPNRREELRRLIVRLQRERGLTTLVVTHDRAEAAELGERLALMLEGRIVQHGPPTDLFERPVSAAVARFFGVANLLRGEVRGGRLDVRGASIAVPGPDGYAMLAIRPEHARVDAESPLRGIVREAVYAGTHVKLVVDCDELRLDLHVAPAGAPVAGQLVGVELPRERLWRLPDDDEVTVG